MNETATTYKKWNSKHVLVLVVTTLLCYWPLSFGIFSVKNDNVVQFLPTRFHISEALLNGHLPLWTPYMYLGYPLHGDMQGGAWNPFVWIISLFGRYNIYSLHAEVLVCIFIAGLAMYRLLAIKNLPGLVKLTGALVYMLCGYILDVSGSNLPFLWAAAFVPFCFAYYYDLSINLRFTGAIKTAIALTLLLVCAYPSFFILTGYILLVAFILFTVSLLKNKRYDATRKLFLLNIYTLVMFLFLAAPALISYLEILPHYERVKGVSLEEAVVNSFTPTCLISFVLPAVPIRSLNAGTDLIMRNGYFNVFLLLFIISYTWKRRTPFQTWILIGLAFFLLFALGNYTPLRALCYRFLPLMNSFRHPANARLFIIIGGIISGCLLYHQRERLQRFKSTTWMAGVLSLLILVLLLTNINRAGGILHSLGSIVNSTDKRNTIKSVLDGLSGGDLIIINGIIQLCFLLTFMVVVIKRNNFSNRAFILVLFFNSFLLAEFCLPFMVSKVSPASINSLLKNYPRGYPIPNNKTIEENSADYMDGFERVGINGFYNKKIGTSDVYYTPTFFTLIEQANQDSIVHKVILSNPYAYFAKNTFAPGQQPAGENALITNDPTLLRVKASPGASYTLTNFWNNNFTFQTNTTGTSVFCLQQLYLPGWRCKIDGREITPARGNIAFMTVVVPAGEHIVQFEYKPAFILLSIIVSLFTFIMIIYILAKHREARNA